MNTISDGSVKDLEMGVEASEEECDEEEIQLLEDRSAGKFIYFFLSYFSELWWLLSICTGLIGACLSLSALGFYSFLHDFLYGSPIEFSEILSPFWIIWLIINYFLYFAMFFVTYLYNRNNVKIEPEALRKLLEEVAETDLMGDPEAWRRIASRVNQCFIKEKYSNPIFYSGEQCRWFFVREIAKPMDLGSYNIKSYFEGERWEDYFKNLSNKNLAERAIANYNKSVEILGDLSDINEKKCSERPSFRKSSKYCYEHRPLFGRDRINHHYIYDIRPVYLDGLLCYCSLIPKT